MVTNLTLYSINTSFYSLFLFVFIFIFFGGGGFGKIAHVLMVMKAQQTCNLKIRLAKLFFIKKKNTSKHINCLLGKFNIKITLFMTYIEANLLYKYFFFNVPVPRWIFLSYSYKIVYKNSNGLSTPKIIPSKSYNMNCA